jgi:hypothetical protein
MTTRRKVPIRSLERRGKMLYAALSEAVDQLGEAERRERELAAGEQFNRAEMQATYPALRRNR